MAKVNKQYGPKTAFSDQLHAEKYRGKGETFREASGRIAGALSDGDDHFREFRDVIGNQRFLPGGRVQAAMGATKVVTPYNCFVSGSIEDKMRGDQSIIHRFDEACETLRLGGGIGYDFSSLRPKGDVIRSLESRSSGPVSFMGMFDALCKTISSSGHRRGAQMAVMRIDHPDIEEFVRAKHDQTTLTAFNVSIGITDKFMQALEAGEKFDLVFNGEVYRTIDPVPLWDLIMHSTYDWAEPGVIFLDTINRMNNLWYCEEIAATNPCGEQPLPPYGACLLGSFNLVKYVRIADHFEDEWDFDIDALRADIPSVVRAMDNVVDRAIYPLPEQKGEALNKRRMGLGVTGLANAIEATGAPYGSFEFISMENQILDVVLHETYLASIELAKEKGAFPFFNAQKYCDGEFIQTLPPDIREGIAEHGIRNSHLTSIAPAGTISFTADSVSSGIENVYAHEMLRLVQLESGPVQVKVKDYGVENFGVRGKTADQVTVAEHRDVLLSAAKRVDSAVSKTCNVPSGTPWEDFKQLYKDVWKGGGKGCTTFTVDGQRQGILTSTDNDGVPDEEASCRIDPDTGRRDCD